MDDEKFAECKDAMMQIVNDLEGFCHDYHKDVVTWALVWFTLQFMANFKNVEFNEAAKAIGDVAMILAEDLKR